MKKADNVKPQDVDPQPAQLQNFLRTPQVCQITGLKTSTLYELMQAKKFPRPHRISKRLVVWRESEVAEWQAKITKRD